MIEQLRVAGTVSVHEVRCPGGSSRPAEVVGMAGHELYLVRSTHVRETGGSAYTRAGVLAGADPTRDLLDAPPDRPRTEIMAFSVWDNEGMVLHPQDEAFYPPRALTHYTVHQPPTGDRTTEEQR